MIIKRLNGLVKRQNYTALNDLEKRRMRMFHKTDAVGMNSIILNSIILTFHVFRGRQVTLPSRLLFCTGLGGTATSQMGPP